MCFSFCLQLGKAAKTESERRENQEIKITKVSHGLTTMDLAALIYISFHETTTPNGVMWNVGDELNLKQSNQFNNQIVQSDYKWVGFLFFFCLFTVQTIYNFFKLTPSIFFGLNCCWCYANFPSVGLIKVFYFIVHHRVERVASADAAIEAALR